MAKEQKTYQELKQELDSILAKLQDESTDIDEAITLHKKGQAVLKELDAYIEEISKDVELSES